jgi:2'-hydroxyisoflavone reductase
VQALRGDRERPEDVRRLAEHGPWDAVIDTIGFVPQQVLTAATTLDLVVGRYVFLSSVNVYTGWPNEPLNDASTAFECPPDADAGFQGVRRDHRVRVARRYIFPTLTSFASGISTTRRKS